MSIKLFLFLSLFTAILKLLGQTTPIQIPFQEDFSSYTGRPDSTKFLNQGGVYVGNGYGVNPRSTNQATFDGLDFNGLPYEQISAGGNPNSVNNGITDYLISQPIDLSNTTGDVILSFWWQKGGVEADLSPELEEGDTLRLLFLDEDSLWVQVWPFSDSRTTIINTPSGAEYQSDSLVITDSTFLHVGFQFMFEAEGSLTGNYDIWSINQIYLDDQRTDQYQKDFSFGSIPSPLLKTYRHMPFNQFDGYANKELSDEVIAHIYSNSNVDNIGQDSLITVEDTITSTILDQQPTNISSSINGAFILNALQEEELTYTVDKTAIGSAISAINPIDEYAVIKTTTSFNFSDDILTNNIQEEITVLDNFFAYDDGTAELGFGIRETGAVAVEFELNEPDELQSLDLHFIRNGPDNDFTSLTIKVWQSLEGINGATEDSVIVRTPISLIFDEFEINKFYNYIFSTPVQLPAGKFYVGYEQINYPDRLMLGCDKSVNKTDKMYTYLSTEWGQAFTSEVQGAPMIRPYFGEKRILSLENNEISSEEYILNVYPNPNNGSFTLNTEAFNIIEILDINGQPVNFSTIKQNKYLIKEKGIYLIRAQHNGHVTTEKVIVQ